MGCSGTAQTTQARSAQEILKEKRKTMHSQVAGQTSFFADRTHFNMWHDYLNLGRLLKQPCDLRETETRSDGGGRTGPKAVRGPRQATHSLEEDSKNSSDSDSINLSSASSFSDTSFTTTSSDYYCRFCKQNGESAGVYRSHRLKADDGRVTCPVLWSYTCPICYATGDNAHTRRYCPQAQRREGLAGPEPRFW